MHSRAIVAEALKLRDEEGLDTKAAASRLGIPAGTVRAWYAGNVPRHSRPTKSGTSIADRCGSCGHEAHRFDQLGPEYVYLLGLYLGDGLVSAHPRGVYRLRIFLDLKYPGIVESCERAMRAVAPANKVNRLNRYSNYVERAEPSNVEVSAFSKSWPCLFPQHGAGKKHERRIFLERWQQRAAELWPQELLRGMTHSDGCRFINTGRGDWRHPRYSFSNLSTDVTSIFCTACEKLDLHWTGAFPKDEHKAVTIYVSRKDDVARMDEFIGPKA